MIIKNQSLRNFMELTNDFNNSILISRNKTCFTVDTTVKEKITDTKFLNEEELNEFLKKFDLGSYEITYFI